MKGPLSGRLPLFLFRHRPCWRDSDRKPSLCTEERPLLAENRTPSYSPKSLGGGGPFSHFHKLLIILLNLTRRVNTKMTWLSRGVGLPKSTVWDPPSGVRPPALFDDRFDLYGLVLGKDFIFSRRGENGKDFFIPPLHGAWAFSGGEIRRSS